MQDSGHGEMWLVAAVFGISIVFMFVYHIYKFLQDRRWKQPNHNSNHLPLESKFSFIKATFPKLSDGAEHAPKDVENESK